MERITRDDARFHAHSFMDPAGRLFWWKGQLLRGIDPQWTPVFKTLFQSGVIRRLVDEQLLISTDLTPYTFEHYDMVVRHRVIRFLSYPFEWCPAMFKSGALTTLDLAIRLSEHGYTLKDPHPWNLCFDSTRPVYIDLLSLRSVEGDRLWIGYEDFSRFWLRPLMLMSLGLDHVARLLLWAGTGVSETDLSRCLGLSTPSVSSRLMALFPHRVAARYRESINRGMRTLRSSWHRSSAPAAADSLAMLLQDLRRRVTEIELPTETMRSTQIDDATGHDSTAIDNAFREIIARLRPTSVLGIGAGSGRCSTVAAQSGSDVVFMDSDPSSVTDIFNEASSHQLSVLPLVMDILRPTPSCGPSSHWSVAAEKRLQCEMVLACGLLHVVVRDLYFSQIVEELASFSKKWLVLEFISPNDTRLKNRWWSTRIPWYTLENLTAELNKHFRMLTTIESGTSLLLLCEK